MLVAVVRVRRAAASLRPSRRSRSHCANGGDSPLLAVALQDAIQKLRAQERAMTERAEASELLNTQIVNSLTRRLCSWSIGAATCRS